MHAKQPSASQTPHTHTHTHTNPPPIAAQDLVAAALYCVATVLLESDHNHIAFLGAQGCAKQQPYCFNIEGRGGETEGRKAQGQKRLDPLQTKATRYATHMCISCGHLMHRPRHCGRALAVQPWKDARSRGWLQPNVSCWCSSPCAFLPSFFSPHLTHTVSLFAFCICCAEDLLRAAESV